MTDSSSPIIFLSGAGGGAPDLDLFGASVEDMTRFEVISYPGWERYAADGFSAHILIADLVAQIAARVETISGVERPRGSARLRAAAQTALRRVHSLCTIEVLARSVQTCRQSVAKSTARIFLFRPAAFGFRFGSDLRKRAEFAFVDTGCRPVDRIARSRVGAAEGTGNSAPDPADRRR